MKVKIILFIGCWSLLALLPVRAQAEKVAVFEEFGQPESISFGNGCIYVQEKTTIFVYNPKDYKFITKFGKEGEGPGEIKRNPFGGPMAVTPYNDKVYISNFGKLSIFSKTGKFIKEYKISPFDNFLPFGKKYICISTTPKEENSQKIVLALFLADENLKKGKMIYKSDFEVGPTASLDFPMTPFYPVIDKNKLFVIAGIHGFAIDAFDENGEKKYRIKRDYKRLKVPSSYKDKTLKWFKTDPIYKQFYEIFKNRISFKDYYPPIYTMFADNGKLYVMTNQVKKEQRECIVMDQEGNEKKRIYLPVPENYGLDAASHVTISDNYFYKLEENIDEETWELYKIKI
ncbi:MAG: hypothetical protein GTO45_25475 [Candidatus Aminicenantes bacterium]|nr:hypothetical protein [Candidatus Aminicenantes bacterium]NIM82099.1 hypothetical protein [Candidatus Aminicenantes bacterium]NIN21493.1 hypothetical protein [Candidatus Aminicenantes bacterium]NIN45305.1 hypothetical protein [Candidatus Aminicenantes bacterium]NIN88122.1 hypothetical protein [Candidatus Aminicenantes bacterium]